MIKTNPLPLVKDLTLEEKIAQMFLIDFSGYEMDDKARDHLTLFPWGGVILFTKNVESREQLTKLNKDLVKLNPKIPILITVDQEGGIVVRADFPDMNLSPGNIIIGNLDDEKLAEDMAKINGLEIRELGFHLTYAPVADVNCNPDNPIIGVRAFGDDPDLVGRMTAATVRGLAEAGVGSCAKHFPGHGDTSFDSHLLLSRVDADMERINRVELPPFIKAIEAGTDMMMTAHIVYPTLDGSELPATLSHKILTGLLREKMGFNGVIITDSMAMKAISDNYGPGESAVMTIKAGSDIVMMLGKLEDQIKGYEAVLEAARSGEISQERIDESVNRILKLKDKLIVSPKTAPVMTQEERAKVVEEITGRGIVVLQGSENLPLSKTRNILVLSPNKLYYREVDETTTRWTVYPYLQERSTGVKRFIYDADAPEKSFGEFITGETEDSADSHNNGTQKNPSGMIKNFDAIVIEIYTRAPLPKEKKETWEKLIDIFHQKGIKTIILSLLSPYGLPENADAIITGYNYSPVTLEKIAERVV